MSHSRQQTGRMGEAIARRYVENQLGWRVLHQNWRCKHGEIDLIADDGDEIVMIEVRTRRGQEALSRALESVDQRKQARLLAITECYMDAEALEESQPIRIDVIGVALFSDNSGSVEHVRDAYQW